MRKRIMMLSTGGTIASEVGPDGLVPKVDGASMVRMIPELGEICDITCREILCLDSSNIQPHHWKSIAEAVKSHYHAYDGFVITHGTDTMAYTAAALNFMLCNLAKPVVLTGSQLPIEHPATDGKRNILNAFEVASSDHSGVYLVFGSVVISGACAKKMRTEGFDAFYSINEPHAAEITENGLNWHLLAPQIPKGEFSPLTEIDDRVLLIKLIPGISPAIIDYAILKNYRALIIEGFGAGGVPNNENSFLPKLEEALKMGMIVVCATQCVYDGVDLDTYQIGVLAARLGALSARDMTVEAVTAKLMWALGNSTTAEEAKRLFES